MSYLQRAFESDTFIDIRKVKPTVLSLTLYTIKINHEIEILH
jgi:hypothetical protein